MCDLWQESIVSEYKLLSSNNHFWTVMS